MTSLVVLLLYGTHSYSQNIPVCRTSPNGVAWTYLGPFTAPEPGPGARFAHTGTGAQIRIKFLHPDSANPQTLYACTPTGGLFRTTNLLDSVPVWKNLTDSTRLPVLGVRDVEFLPENPDVIYIGAGIRYPLDIQRTYGIGVLKSNDGGRRWQTTGLTFQPAGGFRQVCHDILIDPENPDVVHALCGPHYYKSTDGGSTFDLKKTQTYKGASNWSIAFRDIAFKPGDSQTVYLTSDASYFFISKDGGETWTELNVLDFGVPNEVSRMDVAVSPLNPDLIYLNCRSKTATILRSLNGGTSWEVVFDKNINTSYERNSVAISPNNENVLYLGGIYLYQVSISGNTGKSATIGSSEIHLDHRDVAVVSDGRGGDIVYSGNDGDLYRGTFDGKKWNWTDVSGIGMNNMQFYGIGVAQDFSVVPGGTQDLGIMLIYPDSTAVKPNVGGDGTDCAIDFYDPNLIYGISWAIGPPQLRRSTDGGMKWSGSLHKGLDPEGDVYYYQLAAHENGFIYAGTQDIFRLPPGKDLWEQVGDIELRTDLPFKITAMSVAPSDGNVIYAYGDRIYKTINGMDASADVVWKPLETDLTGYIVAAMETDAARPHRVWASFRNYQNENKVWFSGDGGTTWVNVSKGLPPFPVNALAFQAGTSDALYAGTDVGVFFNPRASDPSSEWLCFNEGFPVSLVTDLEVNYCENRLVAGTFGRGIWTSPFAVPSAFPVIEVNKDTTWNYKILRSDVIVKKGNALTLRGEIRLATGKKIDLENNASLILDGAHIKAICSQPWEGIIIEEEKGGFLAQLFGRRKGTVEVKNGATIEGAKNELP